MGQGRVEMGLGMKINVNYILCAGMYVGGLIVGIERIIVVEVY